MVAQWSLYLGGWPHKMSALDRHILLVFVAMSYECFFTDWLCYEATSCENELHFFGDCSYFEMQ